MNCCSTSYPPVPRGKRQCPQPIPTKKWFSPLAIHMQMKRPHRDTLRVAANVYQGSGGKGGDSKRRPRDRSTAGADKNLFSFSNGRFATGHQSTWPTWGGGLAGLSRMVSGGLTQSREQESKERKRACRKLDRKTLAMLS